MDGVVRPLKEARSQFCRYFCDKLPDSPAIAPAGATTLAVMSSSVCTLPAG
jgi:hypothetical protein